MDVEAAAAIKSEHLYCGSATGIRLVQALQRCLPKDPAERLQPAAELRPQLISVLIDCLVAAVTRNLKQKHYVAAKVEKMKLIEAILLLLLMVLVSSVASGRHQSADDFNVFWEKFKTAVIKGDKNTVGSLSKFPLGMSYGIRTVKSKAELTRRYREVFNKQTDAAKCFASRKPEADQTNHRKFSVACPDAAGNDVVIFEFEHGKTGWSFVRMDNINE